MVRKKGLSEHGFHILVTYGSWLRLPYHRMLNLQYNLQEDEEVFDVKAWTSDE